MASKAPPTTTSGGARRWHRFRFDVPVRVLLLGVGGARKLEFAGRGTGMNEGGIGLDVEAPLAVDSEVQVEFTPPYAGLTLRVRGRVRHADGNCYGVEFLADDPAEQQEVELFRRMLRAAADHLGE
jgi:PilZ domain-containing protein